MTDRQDSFDLHAAPMRIGLLRLRVRDLDAVARFYRDVIGLSLLQEGPATKVLGTSAAPLLELSGDPSLPPRDRRDAGLFHMAFLLPAREDLGRWLAFAGSNGIALPTPDDTASINPSGTTGTIFLAEGTAPITPDDTELVIDKLGYGGSNSPEGTAAPYPGSNSTPGSLNRTTFVDTDDNAADFAFNEQVTPQNSGDGGEPGPDPDPVEVTPETIKTMVDAFAKNYGVTQEMIEKKLGKRAESINASQLLHLRKIYQSLKDGISKPAAWFEVAPVEDAGEPKVSDLAVKKTAAKRAPAEKPKAEPQEDAAEDEPESDDESAADDDEEGAHGIFGGE